MVITKKEMPTKVGRAALRTADVEGKDAAAQGNAKVLVVLCAAWAVSVAR